MAGNVPQPLVPWLDVSEGHEGGVIFSEFHVGDSGTSSPMTANFPDPSSDGLVFAIESSYSQCCILCAKLTTRMT